MSKRRLQLCRRENVKAWPQFEVFIGLGDRDSDSQCCCYLLQDKYILTSMSILCLICVWHAIIPLINDRTDPKFAEGADHIALALFASIYVAFHLFFVFWVVHVVSTVSLRAFASLTLFT